MIIARIESFILGDTLEDAIERAHSYVDAGADGVMIHSKEKVGWILSHFFKFRR